MLGALTSPQLLQAQAAAAAAATAAQAAKGATGSPPAQIYAAPAWVTAIPLGATLKDAKIPKGAITSDIDVKTAFTALFLVSQGLSATTFQPPVTVPCAHELVLINGCTKTQKCFQCRNRTSWLPVPKGIGPKIQAACTDAQKPRVKDIP